MPEQNIELSYDSKDAIPSGFGSLYDEKDGKFVLAGVSGMKTSQDVANVQEALRKEREDHSAAKNSLKAWGDLKPDEVHAQLDRVKELELAAEGKLDDAKINEMVESRLTQKTGPLERQIKTITEERDTAVSERDALKQQIERRDMNDAVRSVATEMKVHTTAIPDVEMVAASYLERSADGSFITKADVQGITPGVDVKQFMKEMQKLRPHWWPASEGGGAGGGNGDFGGGANPWTSDGWNLSKQGQVVRDQGMEVAQRMAKAAGTTVGGLKPKAKG